MNPNTQHLILGMLREKEPVTATLLLEAGVELKSAREIVAQAMGPHSVSVPKAERKAISPVVGIVLIVLRAPAITFS